MAYSNTRVKVNFTASSDFSYTVKVGGTSVFSGVHCVDSYTAGGLDITEILKPYVHANEITSLSSGGGPSSISYSVSAAGATLTQSAGTVNYLNDFAATSIPSPVRPQDWGIDKVAGQYYFSYSAVGGWTGSQYGSVARTCEYNAEIVFTDPFGMPEGIPVKAVVATESEWQGYARAKDYQSKQHRTVPLDVEKQLSWTCYTPNLSRENRAKLARWLGQSEYVYLYDVESGQLHPCVTPTVDSGKGIYNKLTIALTTNY